MTLQDFYDILDKELEAVIADNPRDEKLHKGGIEQRKARAFLIWFMQFYGKKSIYNTYITDGTDDTSCDIIFPTHDNVGKKIMYVVQSKWCARKNCSDETKAKEFKATLDDFKLIYSSQKEVTSITNKTFNEQYQAIKQHLADNNSVKFIYLTLNRNNPIISENLDLFRKQVSDIEVIDIERLKRDFIEVKYKGIQPENPLEYNYEAESDTIILPIEQLDIEKNYLTVKGAHNSYTFLVRPKAIYDLFEKYGFKLFFNNIRNPLIESGYNRQILQTLRDAPDVFFYYNNGITAITQQVPKQINGSADKIEIAGLQIINGAQTVYAIHKAYKEANGKRIALNQAMVMFRLVESVNKEFDVNITRFTNQQNPTEPRDFWANDPVQIRLQNESFATNYWYSIRRNEFKNVPENVKVISSQDFIEAYLDFNGGESTLSWRKEGIWTSKNNTFKNIPNPNSTLLAPLTYFSNKSDFEAYLESTFNQKGEYENYFNLDSKFIDFEVAYKVKEVLKQKLDYSPHHPSILCEVRAVLTALFGKKLNDEVLNRLKFNQVNFFYKTLAFIIEDIQKLGNGYPEYHTAFEKRKISIEEIEAIEWQPILKQAFFL